MKSRNDEAPDFITAVLACVYGGTGLIFAVALIGKVWDWLW